MEDTKPNKAIKFTGYSKVEDAQLAHVIVYFRDSWSTNQEDAVHFGRRMSVRLPLDATDEQKIEVLEQKKDELISNFDLKECAIQNGFELSDEQLANLIPLDIADTFDTAEKAVKGE